VVVIVIVSSPFAVVIWLVTTFDAKLGRVVVAVEPSAYVVVMVIVPSEFAVVIWLVTAWFSVA
jgi:hypothetical protein